MSEHYRGSGGAADGCGLMIAVAIGFLAVGIVLLLMALR